MTDRRTPPCKTEQELAAQIKRHLKITKIRHIDLAPLVGMDPKALGKVLSGKQTLTLSHVERIFKALGWGQPTIMRSGKLIE